MSAVAAKSRRGAAHAVTQPIDIRRAVRAVKYVPPHLRPAIRKHLIRKAAGIAGGSRHIPAHWHPSGQIRRISAAHAVKLAAAAGVTLDLANGDLDLAGRWKHGWIPLDAVAALVKAKKYHGGGGSDKAGKAVERKARGKVRTGQARLDSRPKSMGRAKAGKGKVPGRSAEVSPHGTVRQDGLAIGSVQQRGSQFQSKTFHGDLIGWHGSQAEAVAAVQAHHSAHPLPGSPEFARRYADGKPATSIAQDLEAARRARVAEVVQTHGAGRSSTDSYAERGISPAQLGRKGTPEQKATAKAAARRLAEQHVSEQRGLGTKTPDFGNPKRSKRLAEIGAAVDRGEISTRRADKLAAAAGGTVPTGRADGSKLTANKSVSVMPSRRDVATDRAQQVAQDRTRRLMNEHVASEEDRHQAAIFSRMSDEELAQAKARQTSPRMQRLIAQEETHRGTAEPAKASAADITIEHSGDGTLVHGTTRGGPEVAVLKEHGFKWSRNLGAWYLPRNMGEASRAQRVKAVEARLGDRVQVDRGELTKSGTAAERAAASIERDKELAAHHTEKAKRLAATADAHLSRAREISSHIPVGQPILVGHHSEGRHRSDLRRIDSQYRKGFEAHGEAKLAEQRAATAEARVKLATNPQALSRRIDRNEAELRKLDRILDGSTSGPGYVYKPEPASEHRDRLEAMRTDLRAKIEHDKTTLAGTGAVIHSKATVKAGDLVKIRGTSYSVHKANPKTVEVHSHGLHLKYPYHEIQKHTPSEKALGGATPETLRKVIANAPGTPLAIAAQRELDKREGE